MNNQVILFLSTLVFGLSLDSLLKSKKWVLLLCQLPIVGFTYVNFHSYDITVQVILIASIAFAIYDIVKSVRFDLVKSISLPWIIFISLTSVGYINFLIVLLIFQQFGHYLINGRFGRNEKIAKQNFFRMIFSFLLLCILIFLNSLKSIVSSSIVENLTLVTFLYVSNFIGSFKFFENVEDQKGKSLFIETILYYFYPIAIFFQFKNNFNLHFNHGTNFIFVLFLVLSAIYILEFKRSEGKKNNVLRFLFIHNLLSIYMLYLFKEKDFAAYDLVFLLSLNYLFYLFVRKFGTGKWSYLTFLLFGCFPVSPIFALKYYYFGEVEGLLLLPFIIFNLLPFLFINKIKMIAELDCEV